MVQMDQFYGSSIIKKTILNVQYSLFRNGDKSMIEIKMLVLKQDIIF